MNSCILKVALDTVLDIAFDYQWTTQPDETPAQVGQLVLVPFGQRQLIGLILEIAAHSELDPAKLKSALRVYTELVPLSEQWLALCAFAADYYHRPMGEVALPALPKKLRTLGTAKPAFLERSLEKLAKKPLTEMPTSSAPPLKYCTTTGTGTNPQRTQFCTVFAVWHHRQRQN